MTESELHRCALMSGRCSGTASTPKASPTSICERFVPRWARVSARTCRLEVRFLADTQILIFYVVDPERLSLAALATLHEAAAANERIGVSAFSLIEISYAVEKETNPLSVENRQAILAMLAEADSPFEIVDVDAAVANRVIAVPRKANADPGDRLIVATAEVYGLGLISSDRKIPAMTNRPVVW